MDIDLEPIQQGVITTSDAPRRSSRQVRPRRRLSMSTGGSARIRPPSSTKPATQPKPSTNLFEDSVQEDLPAITINQWKPTASQSKVKEGRPRRCTFCQSRRRKCVPQTSDSCQACLQRGLACCDSREVSKDNKPKEKQKGREGINKSTGGRRPATRPPAPQSDIKEALLRSFRADPSVAETSRHSLISSVQPLGNVSWKVDKQYATEATVCLDSSQCHADTFHSRSRRVAFGTPSGHYLLSSLEGAEVDADVEMTAARNTTAERALSIEIVTEAEYQASIELQHHSSGMTFKNEPTDDDVNLGLRVENVSCFLRSLGLDHWISNFHDVGLKSREHLKKLVYKVNDKERMDELWKLLQSQKVPITVWWSLLDGLSKVATNQYV